MPPDILRNAFSRMRSRSAEKGKESVNEATNGPLNTAFNGLKILYNGENATIEARIMAWGYDSNTHSSSLISAQYLHDYADTLVSDLCLERALTSTQKRPIIFIVHSLGGLVLKSALIHSAAARTGAQEEHRSIYLSTYGIIFAGTPHQGGDGVTWGVRLITIASVFVNTNNNMLHHLERDSEEVQRLMRDYAPISGDFRTKFAYEILPTRLPTGTSIMVVPKASAVLPGLADVEAIALYKDHSNLIKFESQDDEGYKKLSGHLFLMAENAAPVIRARWGSAVRSPVGFLQPPPVATAPPMQINVSSRAPPNESPSERTLPADTEILPTIGFRTTGWTILHAAVNNKSVEGVRAVLSKGADPNCETDDKRFTPLWVAACRGLLEISRLLLDAGANVNAVSNEGTTPLKEAAQIGATEVVQLLIERGANLDLAPSIWEDGPLIVAAGKDHIEVVRVLLTAGANSRAQQSGGWSCLHYALHNKNKEMAALILEYSPDVNASTRVGVRPLHLASMAGFVDICSQLVDLGAEVEAKDSGGLTALRVAVQAGQLEAVKMLISRGARTDHVGAEDGHSLMEVALMLGHVSVYLYLEEQTAL
ncbi:hypothetical protein MMC27_008464 [Xylographa pallens]|nr:hypothetical protein [Xylographa pallens]